MEKSSYEWELSNLIDVFMWIESYQIYDVTYSQFTFVVYILITIIYNHQFQKRWHWRDMIETYNMFLTHKNEKLMHYENNERK